MIDLSIIVVNRNTKEITLDCLSSVIGRLKGISYEVVVVDNGSADGSPDAIISRYPKIKLIKNDKNLGFARAVNQGIKESQGKYILSLNSDTRVVDGTLELLVKFMDETPAVGLAGAQLISQDDKPQNSFDNFPDLWNTLLNKSALRLLFPAKYQSKQGIANTSFEVESLVGAGMIIRASALKETGLFDEDYFLFLEETDLCRRMRQKGWGVMVVPSARIYHIQGETKKQMLIPSKIEYLNSLYKFFRKNRSPIAYWLIRIIYPLRVFLQLVFTALGVVLTLGLVRRFRTRCAIYFNLLLWHLVWCSEEITLKGISERETNLPVRWVFRDNNLDEKDLPPELNPKGVPADKRFRWRVLKDIRLKKLLRIKSPSGGVYLMKMYRDIHPFCWLKNLVSGTKAKRELTIARRIAYLGIPTIAPVAIGYNKIGPAIPKYSIVLVRKLENSCGLNIYLTNPGLVGNLPYNQRLRRSVIKAYGELARKIHQRGILQDDFDPNNIVIQFKKESHNFNLFLIDYERTRFYKKLSVHQQILSLTKLSRLQMGVNNTDRLTFLKAYLGTDDKTIISNWVKQMKEIRKELLRQDYKWSGKVSLLASRHIGKIQAESGEIFYRKRYPVGIRPGFTDDDIKKVWQTINEQKEIPASLALQRGSETIPLNAKSFPSFNDAKEVWQALNALLRVYAVSVLPVALIKINQSGAKGIIVFETIKKRYLPAFFRSDEIQEKLTELEKIGIK